MRPATVRLPGGRLDRADVERLCDDLRREAPRTVDAACVCDVTEVAAPDLGSIEALARLALAARRIGRPIVLRAASAELESLVALAGLERVLPPEPS